MALLKKTFKRVFQYKIYRRIIVSFGLMFIMTVTILSCMLFYLFSSSATKEIDNTSKRMLAQISYASDIIYNQATNISTQLINNNDIITFFNSKDVDKVVYFNISRYLTNIQNVYPFIRSIGVYNLQNGQSFDTRGILIDKAVLNRNEKKYMEIYPQMTNVEHYGHIDSYKLVTFVVFPEFSISKSSYAAIVINIDQEYILKIADNINAISSEPQTFVMDTNGMVVSHFDPNSFMMDLSDQPYVQDILKEGKQNGSFISKIGNEKHLVTYVKSNIVNWYFVSIKQYDQLLGNLFELRNTILFISLLLIFTGIIILFLLTSVIYNPIKSLMEKVGNINNSNVDEFKYLSEAFLKSQESARLLHSSMQNTSGIIKENYIYNILKGNPSHTNMPSAIMDTINGNFSASYYNIFVFKIDRFLQLKQEVQPSDCNLLRFIVSNIAQELLLRHFQNEVATLEEDELVVLALLNSNNLTDEIYLTLTEIQDSIRTHFNFTVSIYVGNMISSMNEIAESYRSLKEYSKYHLFCGNECIIDSEKIRSLSSMTGFFPYDIEKKLFNSLHLCDKKIIQKSIDSFIEYIGKVNYYEAVNYSNQIISSIIKSYNGILELQDSIFKRYLDTDLINKAETLQDISNILSELCSKICFLTEEKNNNLNSQRYTKIVEDIKKYMEDHYSDPNLSLELASGIVELSSGYLGKLFKNVTSLSFNDYLNNIRLEKAKELLYSTNEPASKICEKVGIFNVTYFSTLFKKTYGITPSQYRGNK